MKTIQLVGKKISKMKDKIEWLYRGYGGDRFAVLGNGLKLSVQYPLTEDRKFKAYVNGMYIGDFKTQEEGMRKCEEKAFEMIESWHKRFINRDNVKKREIK